jgi:hypothetical protein
MRAATIAALSIVLTTACHSGSNDAPPPPSCDAEIYDDVALGEGGLCADGTDHHYDDGSANPWRCFSEWVAGQVIASCDLAVTKIEIDGRGGEYAVLTDKRGAPDVVLWHDTIPGDGSGKLECSSFEVTTPFALHAGEPYWIASSGERICFHDAEAPSEGYFTDSLDNVWTGPQFLDSPGFPIRLIGH